MTTARPSWPSDEEIEKFLMGFWTKERMVRDLPYQWDRDLILEALARFAAPRGRVVEGIAYLNGDGSVRNVSYSPDISAQEIREFCAGLRTKSAVPCLITILDAPPRGEEG